MFSLNFIHHGVGKDKPVPKIVGKEKFVNMFELNERITVIVF
jgi:hypothetical protein